MSYFRLFVCSVFAMSFMGIAHPVFAETGDLGITASSIRFSEETLYAGETVRVYATVRNLGDVDVSAQVIFYQGAVLIGKSQYVSVLANGASDDVYVDYRVPSGTFNIRAVIQGQDPADGNSANNEAITGLFTSISDEDRDGVVDDDDNCVSIANADQLDSDADGWGNMCDDTPLGVIIEEDEPDLTDLAVDAPVSPSPSASTPEESSREDEGASANTGANIQDTQPPTTSVATDVATPNTPPPTPYPGLFGFGTLLISPHAQFSYRRIDWRTYEFSVIPTDGQGAITYAWDFGDGATSVQQTLVHAFPTAGEYVVTLAVRDEGGNNVSDAQTFSISFFHLGNPWIQGTLAGLFFLLLLLVWAVVRMRERRHPDNDTEV